MHLSFKQELLISFLLGMIALLLFHLDHLVASYSSSQGLEWFLHLLVDSIYVLVYGLLAWLVLHGWQLWRGSARRERQSLGNRPPARTKGEE